MHPHTHTHTVQLYTENLVYDVGSDIAGKSSLETGVPRQLSPAERWCTFTRQSIHIPTIFFYNRSPGATGPIWIHGIWDWVSSMALTSHTSCVNTAVQARWRQKWVIAWCRMSTQTSVPLIVIRHRGIRSPRLTGNCSEEGGNSTRGFFLKVRDGSVQLVVFWSSGRWNVKAYL